MTAPLVVVIGANGVGKSTWCRAHRNELPVNFYDADSIAQGLGSYDDQVLQREARAIVDARIKRHVERGESFGFESTYSGNSRPRIVERAAEQGYETYAVFVGTDDPEVNVERVQARVATRTGHDVPESEIRRRWQAAQENLLRTAHLFDRIWIIDNSGQQAMTVADFVGRGKDQTLERVPDDELPPWASSLTQRIVQRLDTHRGEKGKGGRLD